MIALLRHVSDSLPQCILTHRDRSPIDVELARRQHDAYRLALDDLGCEAVILPALHRLPDAVFVEDTALLLDEAAVSLRPLLPARRAEAATVARELGKHRTVLSLPGPGFIEGGDVLRLGRTLYVGRSTRTDAAGIDALARLAGRFGYDVVPVNVNGCLHLKTACCFADDRTLVVNPAWVDPAAFRVHDVVEVDPAEPFAANVLKARGVVLHDAEHHLTRARLMKAGVAVRTVELSQFALAEAGVTCLSILIPD